MVTIQTLRERLTLILVALLPFHAFLVTVLTKMIAGPGHAPLTILASWKEGLLAIILGLACIEMIVDRKKHPWKKWDRIDLLVALLCVLAFAVSFLNHIPKGQLLLGIKYDLVPLIAFLMLRRVPWSEQFQRLLFRTIVIAGGVIILYGVVTLFLPQGVFTWLGYSPMHSLYQPGGPLASFQQVSGSVVRRVQSTMSGPNQLGVWLLFPFAVALCGFLAAWKHHPVERSIVRWTVYLVVVGIALLLTLSRSAWIAACVIILLAVFFSVPRTLLRTIIPWTLSSIVVFVVLAMFIRPQLFFRFSSTRGHIERPIEAIHKIIAHPFGLGLGSAGPASNRDHDVCVFLRPEDDPAWAKSSPQLCVFLGPTQVQPIGRMCDCPFLPENWYLQIGVELGVIGFALYLYLIGLVLLRSSRAHTSLSVPFLVFLGVSVACLFLHAWEDSAVAYTGWILMALSL